MKRSDSRYEKIPHRTGPLCPNERAQAIKILEWMTRGFRTLKARELEDALAISHGGLTIESTRRLLRARLRNLCRPIIEVTDQETMIFVHFSAKESVKFTDQ